MNSVSVLMYLKSLIMFLEMAGDSFRDAAWDNQLDNMLDDLQNSVQSGETHGYKNGFSSGGGHTSRQYEERQNGNTREVREKVTRWAVIGWYCTETASDWLILQGGRRSRRRVQLQRGESVHVVLLLISHSHDGKQESSAEWSHGAAHDWWWDCDQYFDSILLKEKYFSRAT